MLRSSLLLFSLLLLTPLFASEKASHYVIDCEVYNHEPKLIRRFPGSMCLFLDDGSMLSAREEKLIYYDKFRNPLWTKVLYPHHQMNFSLDREHFLVIGSEIIETAGKKKEKVRSDVLYIISKKGEILKTFRLYEFRDKFLGKRWAEAEKRKYADAGAKVLHPGVDWELTHTNSFYEIPANRIQHPAFKPGHFIVNDISLMLVFVLDAELKKILWQSPILSDAWTMLHDVQVLPDSENLLIYDNGTPWRPGSRLLEYNVNRSEITWQYPSSLSPAFFSRKMGGVQRLPDGNILYNDITAAPFGRIITRQGEVVWTLYPKEKLADDHQYVPFQQIKRVELESFLKNHRGL